MEDGNSKMDALYESGHIMVIDFGVIDSRTPFYMKKTRCWAPIGYKCIYKMSTLSGEKTFLQEVKKDEKDEVPVFYIFPPTGPPWTGKTPSEAWKKALIDIEQHDLNSLPTKTPGGPKRFGFSDKNIRNKIMKLPNADTKLPGKRKVENTDEETNTTTNNNNNKKSKSDKEPVVNSDTETEESDDDAKTAQVKSVTSQKSLDTSPASSPTSVITAVKGLPKMPPHAAVKTPAPVNITAKISKSAVKNSSIVVKQNGPLLSQCNQLIDSASSTLDTLKKLKAELLNLQRENAELTQNFEEKLTKEKRDLEMEKKEI